MCAFLLCEMQLQAGEAVRSTSHGTTAAGLIHSKQQLVAYQMQIDEQEQQLKTFQKMNEECQHQIRCLQAQLQDRAVVCLVPEYIYGLQYLLLIGKFLILLLYLSNL